jgi:hypothetical protein
MNARRILMATMVLVIVGAPLVAGVMNWLPPAAREAALSLIPPMAVALILVGYFNWRARIKSRVLGQARHDQELSTAA